MANSLMLDAASLRRIALGAAIGAVFITFAGFASLGWTLDSTSREMARKNAEEAVVGALAPKCADKFQYAANATKIGSN